MIEGFRGVCARPSRIHHQADPIISRLRPRVRGFKFLADVICDAGHPKVPGVTGAVDGSVVERDGFSDAQLRWGLFCHHRLDVGVAQRHVELEVTHGGAQQLTVAVLGHADANGVLTWRRGHARDDPRHRVDGHGRIRGDGVRAAESSDVLDLLVRRRGGRVGHRAVGAIAAPGSTAVKRGTERIHQLVAVRIDGAVVPHEVKVGAHRHGREFLKDRRAVLDGVAGHRGAGNVRHKRCPWIFSSSKILEVADGRVSTAPLPHQIPAVARGRQGHRGRVNGLFDAEVWGRGAAGVAQGHWDVADVGLRQWDRQNVVVSDLAGAVPHSNVHLVVKARAQGVGGPTISVHFQGDQVIGSPEMGVVQLATHKVRGLSLEPEGHQDAQNQAPRLEPGPPCIGMESVCHAEQVRRKYVHRQGNVGKTEKVGILWPADGLIVP